mmetsp:Transcript_5928/g.12399  ORF Transcript_5928/g.12399 Transcript_5928/m.12399 type:complete len:356 (+) Transcript_5928:419-1486(+)|eukprot:CAMPEP_0194325158 /NCGR_PEP_ID=MMETSP0171-20130528/29073_1 /TAXON_ID=218684 /ORGANISM="Corethron pennatum, Strain L29A3" /LENGTH=355 /DNA_ID=CAMNT_0039084195 /DNA_START=366 /DNA_END=1433 /DNA_ORIENTATION=+
MAHSALLGSRISLISKRDIRYEGKLYSINQDDATVALQSVRSFGTETRIPVGTLGHVPAQTAVHEYLLFRGCDIKDLHVHDPTPAADNKESPPSDPAILSSSAPPDMAKDDPSETTKPIKEEESQNNKSPLESKSGNRDEHQKQRYGEKFNGNGGGNSFSGIKKNYNGEDGGTRHRHGSNNRNTDKQHTRRPRRNINAPHIGTGASLLNRKARGAVTGKEVPEVGEDFDFQSSSAGFDKVVDEEVNPVFEISENAYVKDDFFDSISCDITDRLNGVNNRLRGSEERQLNTATFGAVSLNNRRGGRYRNGPPGGGGRGRGGRGRGGYNMRNNNVRENNRWRRGPQEKSRQVARSES